MRFGDPWHEKLSFYLANRWLPPHFSKNQLQQAEIVTQSDLPILDSFYELTGQIIWQCSHKTRSNWKTLHVGWHSARAPTGPAASPFFTEFSSCWWFLCRFGKRKLIAQALTLYENISRHAWRFERRRLFQQHRWVDQRIRIRAVRSAELRHVKSNFSIAQFTPLFEPYLKQPLFEELFQQLQNCPEQENEPQRRASHE